jgi:hypothetical protein
MKRLLIPALALILTACATPHGAGKGPTPPADLSGGSFFKSEADQVADLHIEESLAHLRTLMEKLYRRNPREWKNAGQPSLEAAIARAFAGPEQERFPELGDKRGIDCIYLAFRDDYTGDRVLAFIWGLKTMTLQAYNDKTDFYLWDELDPQKLYLAARNYEIAAWMLATKRDASGQAFLLSNEINDQVRNLSFEREFGKLIAEHDLMARIVAGKTHRTIVRVVQALATALLYPI